MDSISTRILLLKKMGKSNEFITKYKNDSKFRKIVDEQINTLLNGLDSINKDNSNNKGSKGSK